MRQHRDGSDFASMKWTKTGEEYTVAYNRVAKAHVQLHLTPDSFLEPMREEACTCRGGKCCRVLSTAAIKEIRTQVPRREGCCRLHIRQATSQPWTHPAQQRGRVPYVLCQGALRPSVLGVSRTSRKRPEAGNRWLRGLQGGRGPRGEQGHPRSRRRRTRSGTCSSKATARGPTTRFACRQCTRLSRRSTSSTSNRGSPAS